jgi:hypothetical protein
MDLLGVERQVVAQHAGGLLGRHLGQHRHVVEHGGDVVDQGEQVGSGHGCKVKKGCCDANRPCAKPVAAQTNKAPEGALSRGLQGLEAYSPAENL